MDFQVTSFGGGGLSVLGSEVHSVRLCVTDKAQIPEKS